MLSATLNGGELGFSIGGLASSVGGAASSAAGFVGSAGSAITSAARTAAGALAPVCGLASNPLVQIGVAAAASPGASAAIATGCRVASSLAPKPVVPTGPTSGGSGGFLSSFRRAISATKVSSMLQTAKGAASAQYAGGIAWQNPDGRTWTVAMPKRLGDFGDGTHDIVTTTAPSPGAATPVAPSQGAAATGSSKPFYKNPYVIGGAVLAAGLGGYLLMRKR